MITDIEELENLDASEICPRRLNGKEVLTLQRGENFIFSDADGTAELSGRDYEFREPTLRREQPVRSEDLSGETQGESGESQNQQMMLKPAKTSRRVQLCPFWLKPFFTRNVERMLSSSVPSFFSTRCHIFPSVPLPFFFRPCLSFVCAGFAIVCDVMLRCRQWASITSQRRQNVRRTCTRTSCCQVGHEHLDRK